MNTLGIGIIGLGEHARRSHIQPLLEIDRARVVAGFDPSAEARAAFGELVPGARTHETEAQLLADPDVDAVIVCSPDRFHAPALLAAVEAGKHALVEKPLLDEIGDLDMGDLAYALHQAAQAGLVISSCHPRRYDRPYMWLKDTLEQLTEQLGDVCEIQLDFLYHRPSKEGLHHGLLIDHINHEIDLVHYLLGHCAFRAYKLCDSQVHYAASGSRTDGVSFHFTGSRYLNRRVYPETAAVRFERGIVRVDTETGIATVHDYDTGHITHEDCGTTDYEGRFGAVNRNFVDACLGLAKPYLTADDLLVNTEIGIALTHMTLDHPGSNEYTYHGGLLDALILKCRRPGS
jgi:predicted dehydrogenase